MPTIDMATWEGLLYLRDMTYLKLIFMALAGLFIWRMWLAPFRLVRRLALVLATCGFLALAGLGVYQLWTL